MKNFSAVPLNLKKMAFAAIGIVLFSACAHQSGNIAKNDPAVNRTVAQELKGQGTENGNRAEPPTNTQDANSNTPAVETESEIAPGDRVIYKQTTGTVKETLNKSQLLVNLDQGLYSSGEDQVINSKDLAKGIECYKKICRGNRVALDGATGTVTEVFNNGEILVNFDGLYAGGDNRVIHYNKLK